MCATASCSAQPLAGSPSSPRRCWLSSWRSGSSAAAAVFDHAQHAEIERTIRNAASSADDVGDPPPGVVLIETRNGATQLTPGAPRGLLRLAAARDGKGSAEVDGHGYATYARTRDGARYVAAYDMAGHHRQEVRLIWSSVGAGVVGVLLAAGAGWLIGRRAVQPLAAALSLQRRFVTDASHELRTPLTVLHTRAQILRRRLGGPGRRGPATRAEPARRRHVGAR